MLTEIQKIELKAFGFDQDLDFTVLNLGIVIFPTMFTFVTCLWKLIVTILPGSNHLLYVHFSLIP